MMRAIFALSLLALAACSQSADPHGDPHTQPDASVSAAPDRSAMNPAQRAYAAANHWHDPAS
jgi:hypothetical protein